LIVSLPFKLVVFVLVDGKFVQEQADPSLKFRGSANQVIHLLKDPQ